MGTLTSCSFSSVSFRFLLSPPVEYNLRDRIQIKNICYNSVNTNSYNVNSFDLSRGIFRKMKRISNRKFGKLLIRTSCSNNDNDGGSDGEDKENSNLATATASKEEGEERSTAANDFDSENSPASVSSRPSTINPVGPTYNNFQVDSFKLMELLGPEKVDSIDIKIIKEKLYGYSTYWVTKEEPFGDLGEGILFLGNLRGKREQVFAKLQSQLAEVVGDKYNLFMMEEPNSK